MIDFEIVKVFKRSITIEVNCDNPYENKNLYDILCQYNRNNIDYEKGKKENFNK